MSVWKKIPVPPGGVMPGGLITKIGVAAISLLLAATLLTYTFTGGGGPEAEIDVPEAAGFDLQQRAQAAIEAEARRQAEAAERQLAQLQNAQESTAAILGAGIVGLPGQGPGTGLIPDDQPVPFVDVPRSEAEAVLLETLRLEEMERRRRSLRTEPLVLSYRNSEAAVAELPGTLSDRVQAAHAPRPPFRPSQPKSPFPQLENFSNYSPNSTTGIWPLPGGPRRRRPARPLLLHCCNPKRKRPSSTGRPIPTVGTVSMKDRFWRPFWSPSSVASFPVRSSPTYRSLSIPRTANGSDPARRARRRHRRGRFRGRPGAPGRCLPPHHLARRPHRLTRI